MATITNTATDADGNTIVDVSSSVDDSITLATAGNYSDKNIIFNLAVQTEAKEPMLQGKTVTYTSNGTATITPDDGYDGLSSVDVTVNVASGGGGGGGAGFKVTFPVTATNWSTVERARLVMYDGTFVDMADYSVIAGQTVNGVIGIQCQSRSNYPFHVLKMTIEKGAIAYHDSSFIPNTIIRVAQAGESTITLYGADTGNFWWPIVDTVISSIEMYNTD